MSRWGRGRGASVAVPLDHLFRENSNCPSAARSAATVGKWGITSFTSTRNAPFFPESIQKKVKVEDQNSPLTVPAIEPNLPPPKPKKFFKSRNVDASENATLPTSSVAPPSAPAPQPYPAPSFTKKDEKPPKPFTKKSPKPESKKSSEKLEIPKLKIHVERSPKSNKNKFFSKSKKDEEPPVEKTHLSPNKRYLVRNRDKIINYSEDRSNSPPPLPLAPAQPPIAMKVSTPKLSPAVPAASPTYVKPGLMSPTNKDGKPPIVLRISKGKSRLLSTDSEDIVMSPTADRHSQSVLDERPSNPESTACTVSKPEALKIKIKYFGNKEKSSKHKKYHKDSDSGDNEKETVAGGRVLRASRRNHHKDAEETPKPASPTPGSDNYELYRTLASPTATPLSPKLSPHTSPRDIPALRDMELKSVADNDVEMKLAKLDSGQPLDLHVPTEDTKQIPEPKPPENPSGRTMRHRANINYNENVNSYIDDITTSRFSKNSSKSYVRKNKKKAEATTVPIVEEVPVNEAPVGENTMEPESMPAAMVTDESQEIHTEPNNDPPPPQEAPVTTAISNTSDSLKVRIPKKTIVTDTIMEEEPPEDFELSAVPMDANVNKSDKCNKSPEKHTFKSPKRPGDSSPHDGDDDKPSVKLVITKKKGSIFKSRSLVDDGPGATGKKRHLYRHKWADDGKGGQTPRPEPEPNAQVALQEFEEENHTLTRVTRYQKDKNPALEDEIEPYTSVKCSKNAKDYYTVVRNVKKAHQIQEIGEFQEFNDDVEYILDALQDNNPMSTRCLSAITLASKCMAPAFRMHVKSHGTVAKFFRALHDATNDQSLGLCTATVMFVLSQDRLNMDLDRESLELMLNLLESDVSHKDALDDCGLTSLQLCKNKERVRELCAEIKNQGKAKHLDLDNITVGHLAMETLLSLTSKRAGEWFKEELRALGGVEHILTTICDCCATIGEYGVEWSPLLLDLLRKVDRCMRVLENVTQQNEENQTYLLSWRNGLAVDTLVRLFRLCDREIPLYPTGGEGATTAPSTGSTTNISNNAQGTSSIIGATIRDALLPTLKVLVNLTHPFTSNSVCSSVVGERPGIIDASLHLLLQSTNYIPEKNNFEFSVCVLLLLINLMQNNSSNVKLLMEAKAPADHEAVFTCNKPALLALIDHFYKRVELARLAEQNTDAILDGEKSVEDEIKEKKNKSQDELIEETVEKLLQKAGTHMEHTMIGSYVVLLLGHVAMGSEEYETRIRNLQPNNNYEEMLTVLRKYFSFLNLTASSEAASVAHLKNTQKIIDFLESSDKRHSGKTEEGTSGSSTSTQHCPSPPSIPDKDSMTSDSNLDLTNNSNASGNDITSESDRMSSSVDMDTSFN